MSGYNACPRSLALDRPPALAPDPVSAAASMRTSMRTSPRLTWRGAPQLKPHYMAGGTPGDLKGLKNFWDPAGFTSKCALPPLPSRSEPATPYGCHAPCRCRP